VGDSPCFCSHIGVFIYLITQSTRMAERNIQQAQQTRDELRQVVGFSVADEIRKLDELKKQVRFLRRNLHAFAPNSFNEP
jgi:hypothetical protein